MPFYVWNPKIIGLKIPEMDAEHQVLIGHMNSVYDAKERKATKEEISKLLGDLLAYTRQHFGDEEKYMEKIHYTGIVRHRAIHEKLLAQLKVYGEAFEKSGILTEALFEFLSFWWTSHIKGMDFQYAEFKQKSDSEKEEQGSVGVLSLSKP